MYIGDGLSNVKYGEPDKVPLMACILYVRIGDPEKVVQEPFPSKYITAISPTFVVPLAAISSTERQRK